MSVFSYSVLCLAVAALVASGLGAFEPLLPPLQLWVVAPSTRQVKQHNEKTEEYRVKRH